MRRACVGASSVRRPRVFAANPPLRAAKTPYLGAAHLQNFESKDASRLLGGQVASFEAGACSAKEVCDGNLRMRLW